MKRNKRSIGDIIVSKDQNLDWYGIIKDISISGYEVIWTDLGRLNNSVYFVEKTCYLIGKSTKFTRFIINL